MREEDFQSKAHVTKHMTLNRYGLIEEATRVNSWEEQDYLGWKLFLFRTLNPNMVTPTTLKTISDASVKYRRAYKSYGFGVKTKISGNMWIIIPIMAVVGIVVVLYFMGYIRV